MSRLGNILNAIINKILDWEKVGDVYWGSGNWTVPQNGFIELAVVPNSNTSWYLYITDTFVGGTWSHTISGQSQNRNGFCFPVRKGAVLSTASSSNVSSVVANYYKLKTLGGGVLLNRIISSFRTLMPYDISERGCLL